MAANYSEEEVKKAHEILFNEGLKMRYQVAGKEYVDNALKNGTGSFAGAMQEVRNSSASPSQRRLLLTSSPISSSPSRAGAQSGLDLASN